ARLRERLREFTRVQIFGEVFGFKAGRARVWFELRDGGGALPCSMWRGDWDALGIPALADGAQIVAAGGCDYYPGSRTSSPQLSFAVHRLPLRPVRAPPRPRRALRRPGGGALLARVGGLGRTLLAEGLTEPQKRLPRPVLPRTIGVVTGE